ncbi:plant intracellular Ras-group-related LRR protein 8-like isoform X1 [Panicum virgatum]|uniref:plant intracellular Ras-group-related LRR protein 8-like isoform X1 n=1 Tax=Panicum virgatum TaxID=38727 RepID=UPI0019D521A5|nr:plant intracellular Ras-group-related LRR protein 8-like isoform X1 [Panicum virgatum]
MESSPPTITVQVKFARRTIPVEVPAAATTAELKRLLQPLTNVLPRGQRLVCKGKVLQDAASLSSMQVVDGSKVMLIASLGLHQGDGPITKNSSSSATSVTRASNVKERQTQKAEAVVGKSRAERWKLTGVVALHDCDLKAVPEEVWDCAPSVRILDASNNCIKEIPHKIAALKSLNKLLLTANDVDDENISWEGLSCLQKLLNLSLSQNRLVSLPSTLGSLTSLREFRIANNRLDNLPIEIGSLKHLQILIANNNRISALPSSIGDCESLTEVDLSSNLLTELPEAFGKLYNLKVLHLRNNGLTSLPSTLFKKCMQLITLDLHGTEITNDILRQVEGWEEFDERQRQKHQKQLDFRVGSSGVFDEGADDDNRRR